MGIQRGDVISVLSPNLPAMYELHFAVPMSGAILNTINTRLDARTLSVILRHSESKLIFVDFLSRSLILEAFSLLPSENKSPSLIFIMDDDVNSTLTADRFDLDFSYEGLINKGDPDFKWIRPNRELDPMVLNYTSGTTSSPKGVVHSHRGLFITTLDSLMDWSVPKQPVFLWTLAMFHSNGWSFPWGMAAVGGTNICLRKFDAASVYGLIRQHSVTHMCGAPVVLNMLANNPSKEPLSNRVQILTAGAPPPATVLFRIESLGFIVSHGYGLSETVGCVVSCAWKHEWDKLPATERAILKARQGVRTIGMTEIDVLDLESGLSVKRDGSSTGEIVLRGASILLGYFKDPEGTAKSLKNDGWFYTGDVGVMHPDGCDYKCGENISREHRIILRNFCDPTNFGGDTCAFVSLKSKFNSLSENDIIEFCGEKLPHYMKFKLKSKAKNLGLTRVESRL
ncbi:hypothetical protein MKW92_014752 [Papaver armeniacum]|nr:hypothetical protein MKW92_014752 [Papaver armeniacum]